MIDRHKHRPKAVRMPDGLLAWYEEHAKSSGRPVNALLVAALEEYREHHGGGSTTAAGTAEAVAPPKRTRKPAEKRGGQTSPPASAALPKAPPAARQRCTHPGTRVIGGWCKTCEHTIEPGGLWR